VKFSVIHYAGKVTYKIDGFLEKNRDTLRPDLVEALQASSNELIAELFREKQVIEDKSASGTGARKATKLPTVGFIFNVDFNFILFSFILFTYLLYFFLSFFFFFNLFNYLIIFLN